MKRSQETNNQFNCESCGIFKKVPKKTFKCKHCEFRAPKPIYLAHHVRKNHGKNSPTKKDRVSEKQGEPVAPVQAGPLPPVSVKPKLPEKDVSPDTKQVGPPGSDNSGHGLGDKDSRNDGGDVSGKTQPETKNTD